MSHPSGNIEAMENKRTSTADVDTVLEQPALLCLAEPRVQAPGEAVHKALPGNAPRGREPRVQVPGGAVHKPALPLSESARLVGLAGVAEARKALQAAALRAEAAKPSGKAA